MYLVKLRLGNFVSAHQMTFINLTSFRLNLFLLCSKKALAAELLNEGHAHILGGLGGLNHTCKILNFGIMSITAHKAGI